MNVRIKTAHGYLSFQPDGRLEYRDKAGPWENLDVEGLTFEPAPSAPIPPPPTSNPHHVGPGPLTVDRARDVVFATSREFPHLIATFASEAEAVRAAEELLLRTIWHLHLAGFEAGRQRNPSGAISGDKLTIRLPDRVHVYDIMSLGFANRPTTMQMLEITGENPVPDPGTAD